MDEKGMLQLLDELFAMINSQPEETLKQLVQSGAKPEDITKLVQAGVQLGKVKPEIGKAILLALQGKRKAAHGAKLDYFRKLKNQCPEGEELYYYKKGGSVGCGCKKKEDGGEVVKALNGAVTKFKNRTKAELDKINKLSEEDAINGTYGLNQKQINKLNNPKQKSETYPIQNYNKNAGQIKRTITYKEPTEKNDTTYYRIDKEGNSRFSSSNSGDRNLYRKDEGRFNASKSESPIRKKAYGSKIVKTFKEKCGAKMKKHQLGGSLNGIPFYLGGGQPLYKKRTVYTEPYEERVLWRTLPDLFGRVLSQLRIVRPQPNNTFNNDTIYKEGFYNPSINLNINWKNSNGNIFKYLEKINKRKL